MSDTTTEAPEPTPETTEPTVSPTAAEAPPELPVDPYKRIYNPHELPANPAAAAAFPPEFVDESVPIDEGRVEQAKAAIEAEEERLKGTAIPPHPANPPANPPA